MNNNDFIFRIGPWRIAVTPLYKDDRSYYAQFLCDGPPILSINTTLDELRYELALCRQRDQIQNFEQKTYDGSFLESLSIQRKVADALFEHNALLFHGSAIAVDGQAYLFIAPSGMGKTTHTKLWQQLLGSNATLINDDKNFIEITDQVIVHGTPWHGAGGACANISVPLKAICILEQGSVNQIEEISFRDSLFMLLQQSNRQAKNTDKYMRLIEMLGQKVRFYRLQCNTDPEAAQVAYTGMCQ